MDLCLLNYCPNLVKYLHLSHYLQRTTPRKPMPLRTCGGYWTSRPAPRGLPRPEEAHRHRNPGPRRAGPTSGPTRVTLAHLHRPMAEPRRHQSRPFPRRSRRTSGWPPFTPRRSSPTSTSSSRSLTSLLLFYVSIPCLVSGVLIFSAVCLVAENLLCVSFCFYYFL
jgi:hypothetical protein